MRWKSILVVAILTVAALISAVWVIIANYDYNRLKPQIENAFKEATGRELTLRGNLELKIGLAPTLVVSNAALQNAPWGSRPEMAEIKRFEVHLSLIPLVFHHVEVKRVVLVSPNILIETNLGGESNLEFIGKLGAGSAKKENPEEQKAKLTINELSIRDGCLTYRNRKTGEVYVVVMERFDASARSADSPLRISLNGSYNGKTFEAKGNLVPLAGLTDAGRSWPLSLTLGAAGVSVSLDGTIKDVTKLQGADLKLAVKSSNAEKIGQFLGKQVPSTGPLEMSCRLTTPGPKLYRISELKVTASGSDLEGSLGVDISGPRPLFTADLRSKKLDLRPFAAKEDTPSKAQPSPPHRVFSDTRFSLGPLQRADATVNLRVGEVLSPQLALHNLSADLTLKAGRLAVKPLAAVIGGGNLDGHFELEALSNTAQVKTAMTIRQLDMGAMLRELKKANVLEGRVDARIDVSGRGDSVADLMSGLTGMTYVIMGEGRINNKYIGLLGSSIGSNIFRMINPFHKESPTTAVSCVVCGLKIGRGIAETTALVINSDYMSVVGEGTINLRTEGLDLTLKPVPKEGIGTGFTGKLSLSLGELTRPLKVAGTIAQPSLALDLKQTAITVGKAVGGFMLLGPAGLGGALMGESSSDKQLCPLAVRAAQQGIRLSLVEKKQENQGIIGKTRQGVVKGIGELGKGLKSLFGK